MSQVLRAVVGATFQEPMSLLERDGTPTNLTGATSIKWLAKRRIDDVDADAVLTASVAAATIAVVSAAAGTVRFNIPAATMATLTPGRPLVWTFEVKAATGTVTRYPDAFQDGPGKLIVAPSAIVTVP